MPFCPTCQYEYMPGVSRCPDCGAALVDRLPVEEKGPNRQHKWAPLRPVPGKLYAEMAKEIFEKNGIPCLINAGSLSTTLGTSGAFGGVFASIFVPEDRVEECEAILDMIVKEDS